MKLAKKPKRKIRITEGLKKYRRSMKELSRLISLVSTDPTVEEGRIAAAQKVKALDRIIGALEKGLPVRLERLAWVEDSNREIESLLGHFEEAYKEARTLDLSQFTFPWVKL
jgi:hypothetical protein